MDGFDYLTNILPNVSDSRWSMLNAIEDIRNCGMFRFSTYAVPEDGASLAAFGSMITNMVMAPNTWIYGLASISTTDDTGQGSSTINLFTVKLFIEPGAPIVESYVRSGWGQDYMMLGNDLTGQGSSCDRQGLPYTLFPKPIQVLNARIRVEISNPSTTTAVTPQILLICAEPVAALGDKAGRNC